MIDGAPVVESRPTGEQYIMLAIEVTKWAFYEYREAVCDLFCLRHPIYSDLAMERRNEIWKRALRKKHLRVNTTDVAAANEAFEIEKRHLRNVVRKCEIFFEDGICGLAFHFGGGNLSFFRRLADKYTNDYVKGIIE